jgi:hypothetical protein
MAAVLVVLVGIFAGCLYWARRKPKLSPLMLLFAVVVGIVSFVAASTPSLAVSSSPDSVEQGTSIPGQAHPNYAGKLAEDQVMSLERKGYLNLVVVAAVGLFGFLLLKHWVEKQHAEPVALMLAKSEARINSEILIGGMAAIGLALWLFWGSVPLFRDVLAQNTKVVEGRIAVFGKDELPPFSCGYQIASVRFRLDCPGGQALESGKAYRLFYTEHSGAAVRLETLSLDTP